MTSNPTNKLVSAVGDPIDCFPYEVWARCVCFAAYGMAYGPLPLLSVSKKWEKGIMETPEAWTSLVIDNSDDIIVRAEVFLHLSRHYLLDIHISYPYISWDCLRMILKHHGTKIRAIIIRRSKDDTDSHRSLDGLLQVLSSGLQAPNMEEFLVQGYWGHSALYYFLERCPKLVRALIHNRETPFNADSIRGLSHTIKEIALSVDMPEDHKFLGERQNLTFPIIVNRTDSKDAKPFFDASCDRLHELWFTMYGTGRPDDFVNAYYPRLNTLKVSLTVTWTLQLLESLHHFPRLIHLRMHVLSDFSQSHPIITINSNAPRLTSFTLQHDHVVPAEDADRIINLLSEGHILDNARVIEFTLNSSTASTELYSLLCNTPRVQVLRIEGNLLPGASRKKLLVLPNLELLSCTALGNLSYIQAPMLGNLILSAGSPEEIPLQWNGDQLSSLRIDPTSFERLQKHLVERRAGDPFPSLRHLIWDGPTGREGYQTSLLRAITHVEFNAPAVVEHYMNPLDVLLLSLLQYPNACPTLSTIKSHRYPCWDLLFFTLQERKSNHTVVDIQSLFLPGHPPFFILQELTGAFKGIRKGPNFPIFDPVIQRRIAYEPKNACGQCVTAGYSHCRDDNPNARIEPSSDTKPFYPLEYSELYFSVDDNHHAQEQVEDDDPDWRWWEQYLGNHRGVDRVLSFLSPICHRHSNDLVSITEFTLGS